MAKKKNNSRKKTTKPKQRKKQTRLSVNQKEWLKIQRLFEEQREENLKYAGLFKIETPDIFESEKPKRITKAKLDELQTAYNEYINESTLKRKDYRPPQESDTMSYSDWNTTVINNILNMFQDYPPKIASVMSQYVLRLVSEFGEERTAQAFNDLPSSFKEYMSTRRGDSDAKMQEYMEALLDYVPDLGTLEREMIEDAISESEFMYVPE